MLSNLRAPLRVIISQTVMGSKKGNSSVSQKSKQKFKLEVLKSKQKFVFRAFVLILISGLLLIFNNYEVTGAAIISLAVKRMI